MMFRTLPHWITLQWFRCKSQWHRELVLKVLRWISINKILSELTILTIPYFTGYMPLCTSEGAVPKEMMAKAFSTGHCDVTVKLTFDLWYNVIILSYIAFVLNSLKISRIGLADICLFMASSCFTEEIRRVGGPQCGPGHVCLHIAKWMLSNLAETHFYLKLSTCDWISQDTCLHQVCTGMEVAPWKPEDSMDLSWCLTPQDISRGPVVKARAIACVLVGWLVCHQDYTLTTEYISRKLEWRMGLGPKQTALGLDTNISPRIPAIWSWYRVSGTFFRGMFLILPFFGCLDITLFLFLYFIAWPVG